MKGCIYILFLFSILASAGIAQVAVPDTLEEVEILALKKIPATSQILTRKEIQQLHVEDAGELLQKFSGVTLKNYGGLGGMKTISVRGISGTHTALVVDGFTIQNTQTGQTDLANLQAENIETIKMSMGGADGNLLPVSAYLSGSVLQIQTFENSFGYKPLQMRTSLKAGSFGQYDLYHTMKLNRKKMFISAFGKYRQARGDYSYKFMNGEQLYSGKRLNTGLKEGYGGIGTGFRWGKSSSVKLNYQFNNSEKGLPGAVILYNPSAVQYLDNQWHQANIDYSFIKKRVGIRAYFSGRYEELRYSDYGYLNQQGYLIQNFYNAGAQQGIVAQWNLHRDSSGSKGNALTGGIEHNYSVLHNSISNFAVPERFHLKAFIGDEILFHPFRIIGQLALQAVHDKVNTGGNGKDRVVLNPYILMESDQNLPVVGKWVLWAKRSLRMPSFNELYYKEIGNNLLKPEIANQLNIGFRKEYILKRQLIGYKIDGYYNWVENKIVAVPTKNLFIWSMQNVGKVEITGTDVQLYYTIRKNDQLEAGVRGTYTFQIVRDAGEKNSPTYHHQIAYFPKHTGNLDLSFKYRNGGISLTNFLISDRYALNENIESNRVEGFWTMDAAVFYYMNIAAGHRLKIDAAVKNIFNRNYAFVKYYVMPGTNFLITLNYEFN